ncbi:MAG: TlpA disulfide reductase family protein [Steroidobacter sp.]
MKSLSRYLIVAAIATSVGFFAMQWLMKPASNSASSAPTVVISDSTSSSSLKAPVLTLPEFSLKDRDDKLISIRSWPNKSLIVNFWATWCEPCRREMPLLLKLQQEHAADGFQVIGIAIDFRDAVLKYADAMHISYPLLIGEQDGFAAADSFGIDASGLPFTVFTDKNGNIITTHLGELHPEQAKLILDTIQQLNDGKLPLEKARTHINLALSVAEK